MFLYQSLLIITSFQSPLLLKTSIRIVLCNLNIKTKQKVCPFLFELILYQIIAVTGEIILSFSFPLLCHKSIIGNFLQVLSTSFQCYTLQILFSSTYYIVYCKLHNNWLSFCQTIFAYFQYYSNAWQGKT